MIRVPRFLALLLLAAFVAGCASTKGAASTNPARVKFVDYRSGLKFELVNEAHTDRVELYSRPTETDVVTKVATNEVMDELLKYMDDSGFFGNSSNGTFPGDGGSMGFIQALEVERADGTVHMVNSGRLAQTAAAAFRTSRDGFLNLHGKIYGAQTVRHTGNDSIFQVHNK